MDERELIESGLLESYALGLCSPEENRQVEDLCARSTEARSELDAIRKSLEQYATMHARQAQPFVKERIMEAISQESPRDRKSVV